MPPTTPSLVAAGWSRLSGLVLPVTIVGAILVFVVPVPPGVLDLLLSANVTLAVLVLLTTLAIRTPQEFSAFPTILLTTTLTRLVLNVATTRLILTRGGEHGLEAAGGVIRAFGEFVAGDQVVVGAILFAILVVIQFVVITKGATRISEVAARFMLDGLPGRQMAIDADLHAGLIDQHEAHRRREAVYRQADFFGAMDGAGKFVRGDAVAGRHHHAGQHRRAGCILGRRQPRHEPGRGGQRLHQADDRRRPGQPGAGVPDLAGRRPDRDPVVVGDRPRPRRDRAALRPPRACSAVASGFLVLLAFTALPKVPLLTLAAAPGVRGGAAGDRGRRRGRPRSRPRRPPTPAEPTRPAAPAEPPSERMEDLLHVDPLELEIGYRLIALADPTRGGDLLDRLRTVRQRVARDLGLIVPQVRIRDEIGLGPHEYRLKIRGTRGGAGDRLRRPAPGRAAGRAGHPARRPRRRRPGHRPAGRLDPRRRPRGRRAGRLPRSSRPSAVVAGHFGEIVARPRRRADDPRAGRPAPRPAPGPRSPALVDEVVPGLLRAGELQRVLQNLLRERVSIRDLETILETLAVHAGPDQGHRRADRARPPRPGAADHRAVPRARRPAPRRDAVAGGRRPAGRGRRPGRDAARRRARGRHGAEPRPRRRAGRRPADRGGLSRRSSSPRPRPGPCSRT